MMLQQMITQNPQIQQIMNYINANDGNAKDAFYKMANEKGVNPQEIIKELSEL